MLIPKKSNTLFQPVSLGNTCESKLQIARKLNSLMSPRMSDLSLRLYLAPPKRGAELFGWDVFDYQVTAFYCVREFIEKDFKGVNEREDLFPGPEGSVLHKRYNGLNYIHDYDDFCPDLNMTHQIIDQGYPQAKAAFDRRADVFRARLRQPGDFLYVHVCEDFPDVNSIRHARDIIGQYCRDHHAEFLFCGYKEEDSDLSELEEEGWVTKIYRERDSGKPAGREFEGNDAGWDFGFDQFNLKLPR